MKRLAVLLSATAASLTSEWHGVLFGLRLHKSEHHNHWLSVNRAGFVIDRFINGSSVYLSYFQMPKNGHCYIALIASAFTDYMYLRLT